jgi:serine protease AprX
LFCTAGVAPGVKLINLDVFLPNGDAEWSDLIKGVDWSVANRDKYNITVINLSLGGGKISGQ